MYSYLHQIAVWYYDIQGHCFFELGYLLGSSIGLYHAKNKSVYIGWILLGYIAFEFLLNSFYYNYV